MMRTASNVPRLMHGTNLTRFICSLAAFALAASATAVETTLVAPDDAAYQTLLERSDMVWDSILGPHGRPLSVKSRPILGNGFCGATITAERGGLRFRVDRQDAYGPVVMKERIGAWNRTEDPAKREALLRRWSGTAKDAEPPDRPGPSYRRRWRFGHFALQAPDEVTSANARIRLWDAAVEGEVKTANGTAALHAFACADPDVLVLVLRADVVNWRLDFKPQFEIPELEQPLIKQHQQADGIQSVALPYHWEGYRCVAWSDQTVSDGERVIIIGLDSGAGGDAVEAAVARVAAGRKLGAATLLAKRQEQYREALTRHFLSFPDTRLESMYWINMYRLLSQYHPDGPISDLQGQWTDDFVSYHSFCHDMNTQTVYPPLFPADLSDYARPILQKIDASLAQLHQNLGAPASEPNLIGLERGTDDTFLSTRSTLNSPPARHVDDVPRDFATCAPLDPNVTVSPEPVANVTWLLYTYYRAYRMSMDEQLARRLFTLLKMSMRGHWYLMEGKKAEDGRYHMPHTHSPEFGHREGPDAPYNLAPAKWAAKRLVELNDRWNFDDPEREQWVDIYENIAPWPHEQGTFRDWEGAAPHGGHRHYSHVMMAWPYRVFDADDPEQAALLKETLDEMFYERGIGKVNAWTYGGMTPMYAMIGDTEKVLESLHKGKCWVFTAGGVLIETPHTLQMAAQVPFLQSYNGVIRVFSAVPEPWPNAVFHRMRAEGAFEVSAKRTDGKTQWVHIKSDAGEPCRVQTDLARPIEAVGERDFTLQDANGILTIDLKKGESVLLKTEGADIDTTITPVEHDGWTNWWPEQRKEQ